MNEKKIGLIGIPIIPIFLTKSISAFKSGLLIAPCVTNALQFINKKKMHF